MFCLVYHPAILPYLTDEERELLDRGDLDFIDEDAEPVEEIEDAPKAPEMSPVVNFIVNINGGRNTINQGAPGGRSKRRKK